MLVSCATQIFKSFCICWKYDSSLNNSGYTAGFYLFLTNNKLIHSPHYIYVYIRGLIAYTVLYSTIDNKIRTELYSTCQ